MIQSPTDEQLVQSFRGGEKNALDVLLNRYKAFVKAKVRTYYVAGGDPDDLIQEGMIGLYKAVLDFDAEKGVSFAAFAALCIVRQVQTAIKTAARQKHKPLNDSVSLTGQDGDMLELPASRIHEPETEIMNREALKDISDFIRSNLSKLEYNVLIHHIDGKSHRQISELLGKDTKAVDNTLQRVRKKIGRLKNES